MKTMTCAEMGGPCEATMSGSSFEEMKANGMNHVMEMHPEIAEAMKTMSPEDNAKWEADAMAKYEAKEEDVVAE